MNRSSRIPELDGLRGVAILIVLVWHYINNQLYHSNYEFVNFISQITKTFWSGVDLFFVLSGFLIGGILLKNKGSENYFKTFYARRILRIFPLYYFILLAYIAVFFLFPVLKSVPYLYSEKIPVWPYFVFIQNYAMIAVQSYGSGWLTVTWSLAIEEQFYILVPFLIFILNRKTFTLLIVCLIIAATIFRFYWADNLLMQYMSFQGRMDTLFAGVMIAIIFEKQSVVDFLKTCKLTLYSSLTVLAAGIIYINLKIDFDKFYFLNYTIFLLFFSILIMIVLLFKESLIARISRWAVLRRLGEISYGIYMIHQIIIYLLLWFFDSMGLRRENNFNVMIIASISFGVTYIVAMLSYKFFESKFIKYSHRYVY